MSLGHTFVPAIHGSLVLRKTWMTATETGAKSAS